MLALFFVGLPHQKIHQRFLQKMTGGDYVIYPCTVEETHFPQALLARDSGNAVWFFNDIYYDLHPLLKGRQVLARHGLRFGPWTNERRAGCINHFIDFCLAGGFPEEADYRQFGVHPDKIKRVGHTTFFEIPNWPVQPNAVLFSSTYYRNWNHYANLKMILENLDPSLHGYVTIHPETPAEIQRIFFDVCLKRKNLTWLNSQEDLLEAMAFCRWNVAGGISSVCTAFWFQRKPVLFLRGRMGANPLKGWGWFRVQRNIRQPFFDEVLEESIKITYGFQFNRRLLEQSKPSEAALKMFYPSNFDRQLTQERIRACLDELEINFSPNSTAQDAHAKTNSS